MLYTALSFTTHFSLLHLPLLKVISMSKDMKANDLDDLQQSPSRSGEVLGGNVQHDAVFGEITEEGPQYRDVSYYRVFGRQTGG